MGKVIIAFATVLAVAALAFSLMNKEAESIASDRLTERVEISAPETVVTSRGVAPNAAMTATGTGKREVEDILVDETVLDERPPPELPIARPPEFDYVAELPPGSFPHMIEREPYDPNWAPQMEAQLNQYLNEIPEIAQTYGIPTVTCRTTMCEVAFAAYGLNLSLGLDDFEGLDDLQALEDSGWTEDTLRQLGVTNHFSSLVSAFFEKPEFEQFYSMSGRPMMSTRTEDGVTTLYWSLLVAD